MSEAPTSEAQFINQTATGTFVSGTEWESYEEVISPEGTHYKVGDLILVEPEAVGHNGCERVHSAYMAAQITEIRKFRGRVEFIHSGPIGRVSMGDVEGFIPMDEDRVNHGFNMGDTVLQDLLNGIQRGELEDYVFVAFHYSVDYPEEGDGRDCEYCRSGEVDRESQ